MCPRGAKQKRARSTLARRAQPENVLIALDGHTKLADFGSAKHMRGRIGNTPPAPHAHSLCGTPEYMAPEWLLGLHCCETVDFWSMGCFLTEMLCGWTPFGAPGQDIHHLIREILHSPITMPLHANIGHLESELLTRLLDRDPEERLGARPHGHMAILEHPWFGGVPPAAYLHKQVPVTWLPHLNGPPPEGEPPPPPTRALLQQAANHAQGVQALGGPGAHAADALLAVEDPFVAWGPPATLDTGSAAAAAEAEAAAAAAHPPAFDAAAGSGGAPERQALTTIGIPPDEEPIPWTDDEDDEDDEADEAHEEGGMPDVEAATVVAGSTGPAAKEGAEKDEPEASPASLLDLRPMETRQPAKAAAGFCDPTREGDGARIASLREPVSGFTRSTTMQHTTIRGFNELASTRAGSRGSPVATRCASPGASIGAQ